MLAFIKKLLQLQASVPMRYHYLSNAYLTIANQTFLECLQAMPDDVVAGKKGMLFKLEANGRFMHWATHQESRRVGRLAFFIGRKVLLGIIERCIKKFLQQQTSTSFSFFD